MTGPFTVELLGKCCHCGFGLLGSLLILLKNEEVFGMQAHTRTRTCILEREAQVGFRAWALPASD